MPTFTASDGTRLAYHLQGDGEPIVCIPGGPADSGYFGDLGGLSARRRLITLDLRGTGDSAVPSDTSTYRCDRLVDDVEALRTHLGLDTLDLLGHSGGTNIVTQYVARHPEKVRRLVLVGPSARAVGIAVTGETRRQLALSRKDEPWFPEAFAALEALMSGAGGDAAAIAPFFWGRWDEEAKLRHEASQPTNDEAVAGFGADGAFTPEATRAALADYSGPVLLLVGEFDLNSPPASVTEFAELFGSATLVVQPGAGHYPWYDDADRFVATVAGFLD